MFNKLKLWYAHHQLRLAVDAERVHRMEAKYLREKVIPKLEAEAKNLEIDVQLEAFLKGNHK